MTVRFDLPDELEESIRGQISNLDDVARQSLSIELYRRRVISRHRLGIILGLDSFQLEALLHARGVYLDQTFEDVVNESESLKAARQSC